MKKAQKVTLNWKFRKSSEKGSKSYIKLKIQITRWKRLTNLHETENSENQVTEAHNVTLNWKFREPSGESSKCYIKLKIQKAKWKRHKKLQ